VTVGLPTSFPCDAVVDFMLDPSWVELWLVGGGHFEGTAGGQIVAPAPPDGPHAAPGGAPAPPRTATVRSVRRTQSSFLLGATWDGDEASGLVVRVTTRPGGRSRVRFVETGVRPDLVTLRARYWSGVLDKLGWVMASASAERRHYRQALVVVHGIGEQRPTSTLRHFVEAVFPEERGVRRFVKPDYISPLVGANTVTIPGQWSKNRPTTDVYELYWAHLIRDTTVGQVYTWAFRLLLTRRRNITPRLRPHVYALRALMLLLLIAVLALLIAVVFGEGPRDWVVALVTALTAAFALIPAVVWKVAKLFGSPLQNLIVANILGDAARYFDTSPASVQVRQSVRETGLQLLDELHERGRYGRIIVYGHSLGSVIAYDILAHAWTRRSRLHANVETMRTPALRAVENLLNPRDAGDATPPLEAVRAHQYAAWREFTDNGFEWLVSDLVTAGSPLAHARWLLNPAKGTPFDQVIADRSMPTCPPQTSTTRSPRPGRARRSFTFTHLYRVDGDDRPRSVLVPDHGAMFALVRWTNVFFPHRGVMRGDPVGGPVRPTFGDWVHDVALPHPGGGVSGFAHTKYVDMSHTKAHVTQLRAALELPVTSDIDWWLIRSLNDNAAAT